MVENAFFLQPVPIGNPGKLVTEKASLSRELEEAETTVVGTRLDHAGRRGQRERCLLKHFGWHRAVFDCVDNVAGCARRTRLEPERRHRALCTRVRRRQTALSNRSEMLDELGDVTIRNFWKCICLCKVGNDRGSSCGNSRRRHGLPGNLE